MDRRETERLLAAIRELRERGEPAALATIVRVHGSAYRREGTRMLVRGDGTYECALSGGCLEPSVAEAARQVIATGQTVIVNYDLADDSLWGLGMGCSGAIDVRIERLDDDAMTREWLEVLERGKAAAFLTPLSGETGSVILHGGGSRSGHLSDPAVERDAVERAQGRLQDVRARSGSERVGRIEVFFEISLQPPELVVFGAGPDAIPLAGHAWRLGFGVTVVDAREAYLTPGHFPNAKLVVAHPGEFETVPMPDCCFVVLMNHHVERDRESLRFALSSPAAYIGVLGPRSRYEKLLKEISAGGNQPPLDRLAIVRSPIGLALGAETPEEVATSIMGEVLAVRSGFGGGFLSGSTGSLHRAEDRRLLASS